MGTYLLTMEKLGAIFFIFIFACQNLNSKHLLVKLDNSVQKETINGENPAITYWRESINGEKIVSDDVVICIYKAGVKEEVFKKKFLKSSKAKKKELIDSGHFTIKDSMHIFDGQLLPTTSDCSDHKKYTAEVEACLPSKMKELAFIVADNWLMMYHGSDDDFSRAAKEFQQGCAEEEIVSDDVVLCIFKAELKEEAFKKKFLKNSKAKKKQLIDDAHQMIKDSMQNGELDASDFCPKHKKHIAEVEACLPSKMKELAHIVAFNSLMYPSPFDSDDFSQAADEFKQGWNDDCGKKIVKKVV